MISEEVEGVWAPPPEGGGIPVSDEDFVRNIRANLKRELPNLNSVAEHGRTMVMICGGPTAKQHLEEIRAKAVDPNCDIVCSNKTHDWLVENGITPDIHFIIDPKASKIDDVQHPVNGVNYMIGIQCNPGVFDALVDYPVTRILTYCGVSSNGGPKDYDIIRAWFDPDEFAPLEGGTMAGLRAMNLAHVLGYLTVEFYGFDSCFFDYDEDGRPVYYSYEKPRVEDTLEVRTEDGRVFDSSPIFASQARQFLKWKHQLEWITFIVHGDSLTGHLNRLDEQTNKPEHGRLYSDYHVEMTKNRHTDGPIVEGNKSGYGVSGYKHAGQICVLAGQVIKKYGPITVLDYGCGKRTLEHTLPPIVGLTLNVYDPAIEGIDGPPEPADIVICTDVLEHVEPDCLENVLDHLNSLTKKVAYICICTHKANNVFSDGRNLHLIVESLAFWYPKLRKRFDVVESRVFPTECVMVCQSKALREGYCPNAPGV